VFPYHAAGNNKEHATRNNDKAETAQSRIVSICNMGMQANEWIEATTMTKVIRLKPYVKWIDSMQESKYLETLRK
jgi:hypothetical protein